MPRIRPLAARALPVLVAVLAFGLSFHANAADAASLYVRIGGADTVAAVVNELVDRMSTEPKLKRSFDGVDIPRVKKLLIEQICSLSGGGCAYTGDSMRDVHAGLRIDQSEFYGTVELLRGVMISHGIALRERNELLEILAPMKRDVIDP